jgi:luciferase family oxidoreductase group 1
MDRGAAAFPPGDMTRTRQTLSILDLASIGTGQDEGDALHATVALAQRAEAAGYQRVWYAEHHNLPTIASSATAVLIAHVAAHTSTITLGSGGVMLPNHAPLVIAEQFGTLARLHPGRIELGLGRAPGTNQQTMQAMRRDPRDAERFPQDVLELQGYLSGDSLIPGVRAIPGAGTNVPLFILGSSLFGASLAAHLGLPYAFASHFAPAALHDAVATYRREFRPSDQLAAPHVIAAANVIAADREFDAQRQFEHVSRRRVGFFVGGRADLSEDDLDRLVQSPQGQQVLRMMQHSAVGTPDEVRTFLDDFQRDADADELIVVHASPTADERLRSVDLTAEAWDG